MSFTWFAAKPLLTTTQWAQMFLRVARELGTHDIQGVFVCTAMCAFQEAGAEDDDGVRQIWVPGNLKDPVYKANPDAYPHDSGSDDGYSSGPFQQQMSGPGVTPPWGWGGLWGDPEGTRKRMDPYESTKLFMTALMKSGNNAGNAQLANDAVQRVQKSGVPTAYAQWYGKAQDLYAQAVKLPPVDGAVNVSNPTVAPPKFTEINMIDGTHASTRSRPPINWFIHTQEGPGSAQSLADFLFSTSGNSAVSYHYTVGQNPDGSVDVRDIVDTDLYSWSVLDANVFSINGCFAGSFANQTRQQWLDKFGNAIDVMAYLAVQDCKKYATISANVILPPYSAGSGISDHRYVTNCLKIGSHTDVGGPLSQPWNGFPWDVFTTAVNKYAGVPVAAPPPAGTPSTSVWPQSATDRALLEYVAAQLGPGDPAWGSKGSTLRDKVWALTGSQVQ